MPLRLILTTILILQGGYKRSTARILGICASRPLSDDRIHLRACGRCYGSLLPQRRQPLSLTTSCFQGSKEIHSSEPIIKRCGFSQDVVITNLQRLIS
jgi:hypothetical protein